MVSTSIRASGEHALGGAATGFGATEDGPHPDHELARRERLHQVVVGAGIEPRDAVDLVVTSGEHQDREVGVGPHGPAHVEPVERTGQADVEHHEPRRPGPDQVQGPLALIGDRDPEAVLAEVQLDEGGDVGVVFHHHDGGRVSHGRSSRSHPCLPT